MGVGEGEGEREYIRERERVVFARKSRRAARYIEKRGAAVSGTRSSDGYEISMLRDRDFNGFSFILKINARSFRLFKQTFSSNCECKFAILQNVSLIKFRPRSFFLFEIARSLCYFLKNKKD